ncbi:MAG TPA: sigma-70 family RNA polymerase sigma factor [Pirellulaceae bacterium]|nr:sigma-70 family RNA polymerase sigma factor [Pirellulaceae bacterium]
MNENTASITALLQAAASGQRQDVDALMGAIYDDLHRLAAKHLRAERPDHTLQPTALVHEAYLKLIDQRATSWRDRNHFFAIAARVIRRILVDHARARQAVKRGAGNERIPLEDVEVAVPTDSVDLVALDEALEELQRLDERQAKIVELRFFGGMSLDEIAETLEIGRRSIDRHWAAAKAWLLFKLHDPSDLGAQIHD